MTTTTTSTEYLTSILSVDTYPDINQSFAGSSEGGGAAFVSP